MKQDSKKEFSIKKALLVIGAIIVLIILTFLATCSKKAKEAKNSEQPYEITVGGQEADIKNHIITKALINCYEVGDHIVTITGRVPVTLTFEANASYTLPKNIKVTGAEYTWNKHRGELILSNPDGNITVEIVADKNLYQVPRHVISSAPETGTSDTGTQGTGGGSSGPTPTPTCLIKGTKVTMANGSKKNIEDVVLGDLVRIYDHKNGKLSSEKVYVVFAGDYTQKPFTLHFEDGSMLSIVGLHDLFEEESMKYVVVSEENAESYIGKHFYNAESATFVKLTSVVYEDTETEFYSIYTENGLNCIANGMLTLPDDVDHYLNIFEFDKNLKLDQKQLEADFEKYGVYELTPDDPVMENPYDIYLSRYINIILGKGLKTMDELMSIHDDFEARCQW